MTGDNTRETIRPRWTRGGHEPQAVRPIPGKSRRAPGRRVVEGLISKPDLEHVFGLPPGTNYRDVGLGR